MTRKRFFMLQFGVIYPGKVVKKHGIYRYIQGNQIDGQGKGTILGDRIGEGGEFKPDLRHVVG